MLQSKAFDRFASIFLGCLVVITLLPIVLIVISSFTAEDALIQNGYSFWPQEWSLDAYYYMVKRGGYAMQCSNHHHVGIPHVSQIVQIPERAFILCIFHHAVQRWYRSRLHHVDPDLPH